MPEQLRPESKDLGEAATFIPHSSEAFIPNQRAARPEGLTLNPLPLFPLFHFFGGGGDDGGFFKSGHGLPGGRREDDLQLFRRCSAFLQRKALLGICERDRHGFAGGVENEIQFFHSISSFL